MKLLYLSVLIFLSYSLSAQKIWVDVYLGATNYQGDLQDKKYTFQQAHLAGGFGVTGEITDHLAWRARVLLGKVSADDKYGRNKDRNLNFTSNLFELQGGFQYSIFPINERSLTPYIFAAIAVYHFNPYTHDTTGAKYFLKPLSTEGEGFVPGRKPYSLTQMAIPFGGGVKLALADNLNVGLEVGIRKLFTDYLDDVSTTYVNKTTLLNERGPIAVELAYRGDELKSGASYPTGPNTLRGGSKHKDWYYLTAITLSYRLGGNKQDDGKRGFSSCPH